MTLSLHGRSDDTLAELLVALGLPVPDPKASPLVTWPPATCALVPYDAHGVRLPPGSSAPRMWWDLRPGARVKLSKSHNHQGARQPNSIHIGAKKGFKSKEGKVAGPGLGAVVSRDESTCAFKLNIESCPIKMGIWWLEAAARGGPARLPIVNQSPVFEDSKDRAAVQALEAAAAAAADASGASSARSSNNSSSSKGAKAKGKAKLANAARAAVLDAADSVLPSPPPSPPAPSSPSN